MKKKNFAKLFLFTFILFSFGSCILATQASSATSVVPISGTDATGTSPSAFTAGDVVSLSASDDSRIQSNGAWTNAGAYDESKYLEFNFSPALPASAVIGSVSVTNEYYETGTLAGAKLEVWNGTSFANVPLALPSGTGTTKEISQAIDISSIITTPAKANALKIRFLAFRTGTVTTTKTGHDFIGVSIAYSVPPPNTPPSTSGQSVSGSVDDPILVAVAGTDAENDPLVFSVVASPAKGTLGTFSGNQIMYTPAGQTGSDSFTFKANDGTNDSNVSTVSITLSPGAGAVLSLSANPSSLTTAETSAITVVLRDRFGNTATNDGSTIAMLASDGGTLGVQALTLIGGTGMTTLSTSDVAGGTIHITATSGILAPATTAVTFTEIPVIVPPAFPPTADVPSGTYASAQTVSLASQYSASIMYTEDGTQPTCSQGTLYAHALSMLASETVTAVGCNADGIASLPSIFSYTIIPPPPSLPTALPVAGTYASAQTIVLSGEGTVDIRYTTDGAIPSCTSGTLFSVPISVNASQTITAVSCDGFGQASSIASFAYAIDIPIVTQSGGGGAPFLFPIAASVAITPPVLTLERTLSDGILLPPAEITALVPGKIPESGQYRQNEIPAVVSEEKELPPLTASAIGSGYVPGNISFFFLGIAGGFSIVFAWVRWRKRRKNL